MPISYPICVALDVLQNQRETSTILGEQLLIDNGGFAFKGERIKIEMGEMGWKIIKGKG